MAVKALVGKDRADVAIEVDRLIITCSGTARDRETKQNEGDQQNFSEVAQK